MEPRKGAQRRLAPLPKTASARGILALAVAGLIFVSGCGGDSDPETTASSSQPAEQASSTNNAKSQASSKAGKASEAANQGSKAKGAASGGGGSNQGTSVPLPSEGERVPEATPQEEAQTTLADILLQSPAVQNGALPPAYTCDGKDSWPALSWQGVPPDTAELVLYAMGAQPVEGKLFVNWAVAGLDPSLTEIEAGRLPKGAIVARNGYGNLGYSICPAQGEAETYVFALYALREPLAPAKGFDPVALRRQVLDVSGNVGLLAAGYGR